MDLMVFTSEFTSVLFTLVTRPFALSISVCLFCLRTGFIAVYMFLDVVNTAVGFHVSLFWTALTGTISLLLLPFRILTAIPRERLLEQCLNEMQFELETVAVNKKKMEENLREAVKEFRAMEFELTELEEEHDKVINKIKRLEAELHALKEENLRLKKVHSKGCGGRTVHADVNTAKNGASAEEYKIFYGIPAWKLQDMFIDRDLSDEKKRSIDMKGYSLANHPPIDAKENILTENFDMAQVIDHRRGVALSQSIFSSLLSLLVGMIVWESKDSCMPLVVALFTVVGISLKSVVHFFSSSENKPASDAVALLSLNWFILGILTYPTLPKLAPVLLPPG